MTAFPALPLWTDAYLADCSHLSEAEHGRYLLLLIHLWRQPNQRFPNDNAWLARKFGHDEKWVVDNLRPIIAEFCFCDGNWITQRRLSREWKYVKQHAKRQSDAAKSRWRKEKGSCHGNAQSGNAPTPTPNPHPQQKEDIKKNGFAREKDGPGSSSVTIGDVTERLSRFQASLAKQFGPEGWAIVSAATDPVSPEHEKCLALCKAKAAEMGKGWPFAWGAN